MYWHLPMYFEGLLLIRTPFRFSLLINKLHEDKESVYSVSYSLKSTYSNILIEKPLGSLSYSQTFIDCSVHYVPA
jgi:hypothetical protein